MECFLDRQVVELVNPVNTKCLLLSVRFGRRSRRPFAAASRSAQGRIFREPSFDHRKRTLAAPQKIGKVGSKRTFTARFAIVRFASNLCDINKPRSFQSKHFDIWDFLLSATGTCLLTPKDRASSVKVSRGTRSPRTAPAFSSAFRSGCPQPHSGTEKHRRQTPRSHESDQIHINVRINRKL